MKLAYITYEHDMMASLGFKTYLLKENLEDLLKGFIDMGVFIVYVSSEVYERNTKMITQYQNDHGMNICVMGEAGADRLQEFAQATLGIKLKKKEDAH